MNQAQEKGLIGGKILYTDSTHVKALANKHKKVEVTVTRTPKTYIRELDAAVAEERKKLGKKKFDDKNDPPATGKIQQSTSDPDSGQLHKEGKPDGFHYSEHRTVDSRYNIIVNTHITPGERQRHRCDPRNLTADSETPWKTPVLYGPGCRISQRAGCRTNSEATTFNPF